ncbi:Methyltransferase domain-containing protein [Halogranum amylolyticum]|uniref:Methyltransferase domain-containing protein n=1 Tax=Halogranum amylolyticum TaxID=660520 RepID=A0A1H8WN80_9EURY|nr:methyltransferase domain-containing protein [Halogranum amylolyticum]SEP29140.1 Methyltransferase domain-containing protein [Halogranum amylolyticum]
MRDEVLKRWVKQPEVAPMLQYLRDAEKESAWELLGERNRVLDIASESNITRGLDADHVTRLDFSDDAIEYAEEILGDDVDRYEWVEPEEPKLPFPDDYFDGAVSIGPYDWRFLDIETLTDEVRRVTTSDGLYVFSVPTPRSPYYVGGKYRLRYYTPDEGKRIFYPMWRLADYDLIYQYPFRVHAHGSHAPEFVQEPLVDFAGDLSDRLVEQDDWDNASYLVFGVQKLDYESYLDSALDCLFRPTEENGFWNTEQNRMVRALEYNIDESGGLDWTPTHENQWRYAPFALMGLLQWRVSGNGDDRYDDKLRAQLSYFAEQVGQGRTLDAMPSYGIGPLTVAFSLAADVFDESDVDNLAVAMDLFEHAESRFEFDDSEDSLLLYGWTYLYERTDNEAVRDAIDAAMYEIVDQQNAWKTLFYFDNPTTRRHQNQMYTLWGLARGIEVTGRTGYLENVEQVLDYTVEERMQDDGAFIWEDPSNRAFAGAELRRRVGRGEGRPPHWEFLYECHQTFFANAVAHYYAAGGEKNYDREVGEAMEWIYATNTRGVNLADVSGLGVPMRFMTTEGRMNVDDQQFKGAYEVGSYVMALTNLLTGTARSR